MSQVRRDARLIMEIILSEYFIVYCFAVFVFFES